jgi:hypothetical protein
MLALDNSSGALKVASDLWVARYLTSSWCNDSLWLSLSDAGAVNVPL